MQSPQIETTWESLYQNGLEVVPESSERSRIKTRAFGFLSIKRGVYRSLKRIFDLVSATCLLLVISPLMLGIAIAIKATSKGPVFFRHKRIGMHGKDIYLWKFRSMVTNANELFEQFTPEQKKEWEENFKLKDDPRITKIGAFLRKTSLDELPQLFNIIRGDLSVVGPRPVIQDELERYGFFKGRFLSAKPGLTGYWQVHGRSAVSYRDRMLLELHYINNACLTLDIQILWRTFGVVFRKTGAV